VVKPSKRKQVAQYITTNYKVSINTICNICSISKYCYYYQPKLSSDNELIANMLIELTNKHKRWGFKLCYYYIRNVRGYKYNHKRIYRIYKELELNLRIKPRIRIKRDKPDALAVPTTTNEVWSMDFMSDALTDGTKIRSFNIVDDYNKEALTLDISTSLPTTRVIKSLTQIIEQKGKPKIIRCDNGPEYISRKLKYWAKSQGIYLQYIQPGKPTQNAFIERFNRTARQEYFNMHLFTSVKQAQDLATKWLWYYNHERPHFANNGYPPLYKPQTNNKVA
jgi:putative transposase